jgi:ElaB/YqjD/DUF883 family membrane-anchored ribosome-binding protein
MAAAANDKRDPEREAASVADRVSGEMKRAKDNISQSAAVAREDFAANLERLTDDVAHLRDTVSELARTVAAEVGSAAGGIGNEVASSAKAQASSVLTQLEDTARRNPLGTIAGALLVGMFIGLFQGRR